MSKRKKKHTEEPLPSLAGKPEKEELLEHKPEKPKTEILTIPIRTDDIQDEIDDIEHIVRMTNIKHNTPDIKSVEKYVKYADKKVTEAFYKVEIGK